jgi:pyridoxine/pyridoxamine 5'-phosphate oxidase
MQELTDFMLHQRLAVVSSISPEGKPESAVVAVAVSRDLELVFDTLRNTRKFVNLRHNPHVSVVLGGWNDGDERTVQYEGIAEIPGGTELRHVQDLYFDTFPEGRERMGWGGISYVRIKPDWLRFSDFNVTPPKVIELRFPPQI